MTMCDFAATRTSMTTPGPGAYDTEQVGGVGGPYSIKRAILEKHPTKPPITQNIDYPPVSSSLSKMTKTIGGAEYNRKYDRTPGPDFVPHPNEFFPRGHRLPLKERYKEPEPSSAKLPGPGQYSPQDLSKTKTPPQGARAPIILASVPDSPGPAAYEIPDDFGRTSSRYSFARGPRDLSQDDEMNPGMAYNSPGNFGRGTPRYSFPKAPPPEDYINDNPGPGTYEPEEAHERRIYTAIHPKYKEKDPDGVGVPYQDTRQYPEYRPKTIGSRCRSRGFFDREESNLTGPDYLPPPSLNRRNLTIGLRWQDKKGNETPGPSDYNPRDPKWGNDPVFTVKGPASRDDWLPTKSNIETPGPGAYDVRGHNNLPRWSIGTKSFEPERERARTRAARMRASTSVSGQRSSRKAATSLH